MPGRWGDGVVEEIAAMLDVHLDGPLAGGQFGAYRAVGRDDRALVLKAWPFAQHGDAWARGAALATRLRARGYPAPEYLGAGATEHACWSLQELLPGAVPAALDELLASELVGLARRHIGAAPERDDFGGSLRSSMRTAVSVLETRTVTQGIAAELADLMDRTASTALRTGDVVHGDFHSRNLLAVDARISGVFDWEGAAVGDWRCDLANLVVTSEAAAPADALRQEPADVAALLVGWHCARYLAFDITNQPPERVEAMAPLVERRLAQWWRAHV